MIGGSTIHLDGKAFTVPALTLRQFVKHREVLTEIRGITEEPTDAQVEKIVSVVHAALSRNYPDMTVDAVWDGLDLREAPKAVAAIAGQSALEESGNA